MLALSISHIMCMLNYRCNIKLSCADVRNTLQLSMYTVRSNYYYNYFSNSFDTESNGIKFTRTVRTSDLITMVGEVPQNALVYDKVEESAFVGLILQESHGKLEVRINFGNGEESDEDNNDSTYDNTMDFSKQFQSNATYSMKRAYCQSKSKRGAIFTDLSASDVERGSLLAVIDVG